MMTDTLVTEPVCRAMVTSQEFAGIADMYTFHLEVVAPRLSSERHEEVVQLAKRVSTSSGLPQHAG
jgi:hypothetical protein